MTDQRILIVPTGSGFCAWSPDLPGCIATGQTEEETRERHLRYGGTVYLVQPDIKHGPGGLRDWAATRWCFPWEISNCHAGRRLRTLRDLAARAAAGTDSDRSRHLKRKD